MAFADNLKQLPATSHLRGLTLCDAAGQTVARLENQPGQSGSVAVYAALAQRFGAIDAAAARAGLELYAEHTADARSHSGKHPNIDRLLTLLVQGGSYSVHLLTA
ncbi:MAG TPA: DUF2322 family protein [Rhizobacter sp.]|nr:DUF2322 family protein [Rhizobacter sp.]